MKFLKRVNRLLVGIVVIAVLVLAAWLLRKSTHDETGALRSSSSSQTSLNPSAMITAQEFVQREQAEKIINETQGKAAGTDAYETILTGVVPSPTAPALVYFATISSNSQELFTGVYLFDTLAQRWQRIYKRTTAAEEGKAPHVLRVLGIQNEQLILLQDLYGRKMSRCESLWLQDPSSLVLLDIHRPYDGFKPFTLPSSLRDAEKARVSECLSRP